MLRKNAKANVHYRPLSQDDSGPTAFVDEQFKEREPKIPWKAIFYAFVLFALGTITITFSVLIITGHFDEAYSDRIWPLFILGTLMFIPGAYHSYLAYYALKGYHGFDFSDIPTYSDDWY